MGWSSHLFNQGTKDATRGGTAPDGGVRNLMKQTNLQINNLLNNPYVANASQGLVTGSSNNSLKSNSNTLVITQMPSSVT